MKKSIFLFISLICSFAFQSCKETENEEVLGANALGVLITIFDAEGNCLLDPEFQGNIVSGDVKMMRNGKTYPFIKYTDEDYLWSGATAALRLGKRVNGPHVISPLVFGAKQWFKNEIMIIEWGGDIENDTIVFTGGLAEFGRYFHVTINVKKIDYYGEVVSLYDDNIHLYTKDMSPKK